jgi:predicted RNA binding protein YcfA (HicA-like mRNA interferase family)
MPKLGIFSGQEVRRILEGEGFALVRQKGSHMALQKRLEGTTVTVPVPNHTEIRIGTLRSIIRQSGVPRVRFIR